MLAPFRPVLLAAACLAAAGCISSPKDVLPVATNEPACERDPADSLHMASSRPDAERDWQVEAIMSQQPADSRLLAINRQMYLSLHALDVELRREQWTAECENPDSTPPALEAEAGDGAGQGPDPADGAGSAGGPGGTGGGGPAGGTEPGTVSGTIPMTGGGGGSSTGPSAPAASQNPPPGGVSIGTGSPSIRKTNLAANGGGGNGATAQKVNPASDNDIVARRLRKAAEQETNPELRTKLWKEYTDYRQAMTGK